MACLVPYRLLLLLGDYRQHTHVHSILSASWSSKQANKVLAQVIRRWRLYLRLGYQHRHIAPTISAFTNVSLVCQVLVVGRHITLRYDRQWHPSVTLAAISSYDRPQARLYIDGLPTDYVSRALRSFTISTYYSNCCLSLETGINAALISE